MAESLILKESLLQGLYSPKKQKDALLRWGRAEERFRQIFGKDAEFAVSSPGRTEICGNHCDHQGGLVIAAAVDSDILAFAAQIEEPEVHIFSEGYGRIDVDLRDLSPKKKEEGTSAALIRGTAAGLKEYWIGLHGFEAYVISDVPAGSGISSSAAFEDLITNIFVALSGSELEPSDIARAGQFAENRYYGKPSGLMDQMAVATGGLACMDFAKDGYPVVERIDCDFSRFGLDICLVATGSSHQDQTEDYAAIPAEMKKVASFFGKKVLREVSEGKFYDRLGRLRSYAGDGAVLRAIHFFEECRRVQECKEALIAGDAKAFLSVVRRSGDSSWKYLQNVDSFKDRKGKCPAALALALSENILKGEGASRIHGGGFGGTIQAFVPSEATAYYVDQMEKTFGKGACSIVGIRDLPGGKIG